MFLDGLGIYWQSEASMLFNRHSASEILSQFTETWSSETHAQLNYVFTPFSTTGRLTINKAATETSPRFVFELRLNPITCTVNNLQYIDMMNVLPYFTWLSRRSSFQDIRPTVPLQRNVKVWWRFAADAMLVDFRRRTKAWSWKAMAQRIHQRRRYVELFAGFLESRSSSADKADLTSLEEQLTVADIIMFRKIAQAKVDLRNERKSKASFFSNFFGSSGNESAIDKEAERTKFLQLLADDAEFTEIRSVDIVDLMFQIRVEALIVNIHDDEAASPLLCLQLHDLALKGSRRPAAASIRLNLTLAQFFALGRAPNHQLTQICTPQAVNEQELLLSVLIETNPAPRQADDPRVDLRLELNSSPLRLDLRVDTLLALWKFFQAPARLMRMASAAVRKRINQLSHQSKVSMQHLLSSRKVRWHPKFHS